MVSIVASGSDRPHHVPGVVHHDVDAAEVLHGGVDDRLAALDRGDVGVVGDRRSPGRLDLLHHLVGRAGVTAGAERRPAQVVDHHLGAKLAEQQRVGAADPPAGPGHRRDAPVKPQSAHHHSFCRRCRTAARVVARGQPKKPW